MTNSNENYGFYPRMRREITEIEQETAIILQIRQDLENLNNEKAVETYQPHD